MSRQLVRALTAGAQETLAVPLALAPAARIQERDWEAVLTDPTQLANALRDLVDAVGPDGLTVSDDDTLIDEMAAGHFEQGPHCQAALEATQRLRQSLGDQVALVAVLPGPTRVSCATARDLLASANAVQSLGQLFLAAGVDVILVRDSGDQGGDLKTLQNIARFHQALAVAASEPAAGLHVAVAQSLTAPVAATGVVVTEDHLPRDTDFGSLEGWLDVVRG